MKQKMRDDAPTQGAPDKTSGDGVLKDLVAKAKALAPALDTAMSDGDPRRRGQIKVVEEGHHWSLYIDRQKWAEVEYHVDKKRWCIQDCTGHCLSHLDSIVYEMGGSSRDSSDAIKKATEMIRDGSMPTPEQAKEAFRKRREG